MSNRRTLAYTLAFLTSLILPPLCRAQVITTVAGVHAQGYSGDGGPATSADLSNPEGLVIDSAGDIYFADKGNYVVREVNTAGIINTVAGPGSLVFGAPLGDGGPATSANFSWTNSFFVGMAMDAVGNLYISDSAHFRIRKINPQGIISTEAGSATPGSAVMVVRPPARHCSRQPVSRWTARGTCISPIHRSAAYGR